jgi:quercetin dioxygenase-like cupin family protein
MLDKIPTITESALSNNGARAVLHAILAREATTYPHYHTLFSETFTLLGGSMTVYASPDLLETSFQAKELQIGESVTVSPGQLHKVLIGDEETTNKVTFEPGALDFERAMLIM